MRIAVVTDTYHPNVNGVVQTITMMERFFQQRMKLGLAYKIFHPGVRNASTATQRAYVSAPFLLYPDIRLAVIPYALFRYDMASFEPDVVHIITEGPMGMLAQRYCRETGIPYVTSFTTDLGQYLSFYSLKVVSDLVNQHLSGIHGGAFANLVPSPYAAAKLEALGCCRLTLWGRGIDTTLFNPAKRDEALRSSLLDGDGLLLMYCGRLAREKKVDVLLDMMRELDERGVSARLILVGDGPHRAELERRSVPNVRFMGIQRGEDLARLYASADLFAFASENETYGNVIQEAMASGLPVVAVNEGGVRENLRDRINGLAVRSNDGISFAAAVSELAADPSMRSVLSRQAMRQMAGRSWDSLFERLITLYGEADDACGQDRRLEHIG